MEGCNVELARSGSRLHPGLFVQVSAGCVTKGGFEA